MICRPDKTAVIQRNYHAMSTNSAVLSPQIRGRSRPFRSLLVAVAGALIFMGFTAPRVDAVVVSYFNFEDSIAPTPSNKNGTVDLVPDKTIAAGGDNAGGGVEVSTTNLTITTPGLEAVTPGLLINRTTSPADQDTADPGFALNLSSTGNGSATISFGVNLQFYAGLSLSFATNNNGNGYRQVQLSWSGAVSGSLPVQNMPTNAMATPVTFDLTGTNLNGNGTDFKFVTFTLTFTNGQSNGVDLQTVIDNIRLDANIVVPEPATVVGGLLGVFGLCWHQRGRLVRFLRLRPA
jgi:hypothetical protein